MKIAVREACDGVESGDGGPFGAVVARGRNVIATGHNMVLVTNDPTMHAEVVAIRNACKKIEHQDEKTQMVSVIDDTGEFVSLLSSFDSYGQWIYGLEIALKKFVVGHPYVFYSHFGSLNSLLQMGPCLGNYDLSGYTLYTSCYPCPMCMGACLWARLSTIYYGATAEQLNLTLQASTLGFDDKPFHDFLKNPGSDEKRKLEHLPVGNYLQPFDLWVKKGDTVRHY
ncbi:unnamed protein product [Angiostrongylus costaricensis]|uniref:CMP/dCMP-type deaminase domain-containing protein n=1 Tax=Angiostrongylus costaricensis TaxID=334426 RepID=A0A0R3PZ80_ANGCS|nr:unnamed protein product [Angiostrongylus costaricensis]